MRRVHLVFAGALGFGALISVGCIDFTAEYVTPLIHTADLDGGPDADGGPDGDGGPDADSGPPPSCIPSMNSEPVAASCGVFVSAIGSDTTGKGTPTAPYKTIGKALTKNASTIYACAGTTPFSEALMVDKKVALFGALNCTTWAYNAATKTQLTAPSDAVPLTLASSASGTEVEDFAITSANATVAGGSSIAVAVEGGAASFERCDLRAGDGVGGLAGASGGAQAMQAEGGKKGDDAGTTGTQNGGAGGVNAVCGLSGGMGGGGGTIANGSGGDGAPGDNGNGGPAGTGDMGAGCGGPNPNGTNGSTPGFGAGASGVGTVDAIGYHGADGQPGMDGTNGTSGGGGGGSKASATVHGAGGGGGGAGGCGGKLGEGGKAGGSSIALLTIGATMTMRSCTLNSGKGEIGGTGGDGQFGQFGGAAGSPGMGSMSVAPACSGGSGGKGGDGGAGGGGLGGHSLGIAATGTALMLDAATTSAITPGTKGAGGAGGNMNANMNQGADGMTAACWDFMKNMACN